MYINMCNNFFIIIQFVLNATFIYNKNIFVQLQVKNRLLYDNDDDRTLA